ncbi:MAG: PAS domain S-box protein [Candidatus Hydrogenedentes bacterium]|nr:PAS domain S-box protein [Candidatus Hydrogenedentota bacterium]
MQDRFTEQTGSLSPLYASDAWIRGVVETAVDAIISIDERGIIEYMNPAAQNMFGFSLQEAYGQNVNLLMPEPYRAEHDRYVRNYVETGRKKIIGIGREVTGRHKTGRVFPIHLAVSEVQVEGRRVFTGIIRDMSQEKRGQEQQARLLRELKERNKTITCLYSVGEVIRETEIESDVFQGIVRLIRPACYRPEITRTRIHFDGQFFVETTFEVTPWHYRANIVVAGRERGYIELVYLDDPQQAVPERFLQADRHLIDAIAHTVGETIERREAEAQVIQASKLASIGELAAGVGHEINNPINGIMNCADILLQNLGEEADNRQFAELIRSEADRIATIVRNLLAFSRQEREQHSLARIYDIVQATLSLCGKKISHSHITLDLDVPETLPKVKCRSEQMQQVLMNLIINSIHALDERFPDRDPNKLLRIRAGEVQWRDRPFLRLTVEDHGTGIAPQHRERLFDPFFTTKGRDKGTGLGLSVSDGIVKNHGGWITVETEPGRFTRFHVDLPLDNEWALESGFEPLTAGER